jgi:hypothetical protein
VLTLRRGRVTAITERRSGLVRAEVGSRACVAYPRLTGPVALGDDVLVNTQAVDLGLGSGGFDVLYANLTRGLGLAPDAGAHVMKLPYTPLQAAIVHAEEAGELPSSLTGLPVVCATLHSQVAPICAALGRGRRVAYVQLPGGALPVSLSDTLAILRREGFVESAIAVGACIEGDVACVTAAGALAFAAREGFDVVVCSIGPGIVGTGSSFGHGAMAVVEALGAAASLGGSPILAPRVSLADSRARHRPLSHHAHAVLALCPPGVTVAWPAGLDEPELRAVVETVDVTGWREACAGLPLESMGRGPDDDPWFFAAAYAAGALAAPRLT